MAIFVTCYWLIAFRGGYFLDEYVSEGWWSDTRGFEHKFWTQLIINKRRFPQAEYAKFSAWVHTFRAMTHVLPSHVPSHQLE